jgi:hypothetical protein
VPTDDAALCVTLCVCSRYGVTSEGVAVFLGEALRAIGIRPTAEPWSIKLTGGPDGDVCTRSVAAHTHDPPLPRLATATRHATLNQHDVLSR